MRILVIGSGAVGTAAATLFAGVEDIKEVVIGDINLDNAGRATESIRNINKDAEVNALQLDASVSPPDLGVNSSTIPVQL